MTRFECAQLRYAKRERHPLNEAAVVLVVGCHKISRPGRTVLSGGTLLIMKLRSFRDGGTAPSTLRYLGTGPGLGLCHTRRTVRSETAQRICVRIA